MGKIIAIGGGEIGRPGTEVETLAIDEEIVRQTGKGKPRFLFLPTASSDAEEYTEVVKKYFGERLGCAVDVLYLIREKHSLPELEARILHADIIHVGGGNTLRMMTIWRRLGVDGILKEAFKRGIVLSGVSAGAICWFEYGNSDSRSFTSEGKQWDYIRVRGLGLYPALLCPHYDTESKRVEALQKHMKGRKGVAIALDNCSAIEIVDDEYRILTSQKGKNAYKAYWERNEYHISVIEKSDEFRPMKELLLMGQDEKK